MTTKRTGRPPAAPPPMTYQQWTAAGHPPLSLSVAHVAAWCSLSIVRVSYYCRTGALNRVDTRIATDDPRNLEWLLNRDGYAESKSELYVNAGRPPGIPNPPKPQKTPNPESPWGFDPPPRPSEYEVGTNYDQLDLSVVLDAIARMDLGKLSSAAVQKVQRLESAFKTRVEREAKRGDLVQRSLVSTVFARLYQVDTNELRTIAAKVAPGVAGELGVEDPEALLRIEKLIDDEVLKVLAHIKRLMDDFLAGVGAEQVPEC